MKIKVHNPNNLPLIDYREIQEIQGDLKDLNTKNYEKLKRSMEEFGFFIPFYLWSDKGTFRTLDGHQRLRVLKNENVEPYELPYILIEAANLLAAKKKLLVISSQYGTITQEGFDTFTADFETDWTNDFINFDKLYTYGEEIGKDDFTLKSGDKEPFEQMTFTLATSQAEIIKSRIAKIKNSEKYKQVEKFGNENSNGNALYLLVLGDK